MVDIRHKHTTLRTAIAEAEVYCGSLDTITLIEQKKIPKGDVFEFARAAGLLAIKKTSDLIPDCHPLPIEYAVIRYRTEKQRIFIEVEVSTIYKTGVEVEAMHGASLTALTIYDMLKPVDKKVEIRNIRLLEKRGGKSDNNKVSSIEIKTMLVVCSDSVYSGKKKDMAGQAVLAELNKEGIIASGYCVIPDDKNQIETVLKKALNDSFQLILFCGGTGLSSRDITPQSIEPFIEISIPGIMEAARNYGMQRTPYAMLSRGIAGTIGKSLVVTLPGSTRGALETLQAILPTLQHIFWVQEGKQHN